MPFPNVYEPRPVRESKPLSDEEQKKLESELSNLRDSQNRRANADPAQPETKKEATKGPAKPAKEAAKPAKPAPKKVADKPKPKAAEAPQKPKKKDDPLVPDQKSPTAFKPID